MIFDEIQNLKRYSIPHGDDILNFIATHHCDELPVGEIPIVGEDLFVKVMEYEPKPLEHNNFETHRVHADLQYIVRGVELMQYIKPQSVTPITPYDPLGDYQFYKNEGHPTDMVVEPGSFAVFYPGEPHRPACLHQNNKNKVKKLVFKIKIH